MTLTQQGKQDILSIFCTLHIAEEKIATYHEEHPDDAVMKVLLGMVQVMFLYPQLNENQQEAIAAGFQHTLIFARDIAHKGD